MATAEYYCQTWIFYEANGPVTAPTAYPLGSRVTIGRQRLESGLFMLAWTDLNDGLHVLTDLILDESGSLAGPPLGAVDLATGIPWLIHIHAREESGAKRIEASLSSLEIEGNLTGAWGAEAPPHP